MKTVEIVINDSAYRDLKWLSDKLQVSMGGVVQNLLNDGIFHDYYEEEISQANRYEESEKEIQENFWTELRTERRLER